MPRAEGAAKRDAVIRSSEDDPLWKLIKAQVEMLMEKLLIGKVSDENFINRHSEKYCGRTLTEFQGNITPKL